MYFKILGVDLIYFFFTQFTEAEHGFLEDRVIAQVVNRWLPTAAARVRVGQHVGFVVDKAALGQVLSEYFGFPFQSFHHFLQHHNHQRLVQ
jgi:hypothetical protein